VLDEDLDIARSLALRLRGALARAQAESDVRASLATLPPGKRRQANEVCLATGDDDGLRTAAELLREALRRG
jgi:hypothetical protein